MIDVGALPPASILRASRRRNQRAAGVGAAHVRLRRNERKHRLLDALSEATADAVSAEQIALTAMRLLREALGADRCAWAEVEEDGAHFSFVGADVAEGVSRPEGRFSLAAFGAACLSEMRRGRAFVCEDALAQLPDGADRDAYRAVGVRALVATPLFRAGRFVAGTGVHMLSPRAWSAEEIALIAAVTRQCGEAIERVRAEAALRRSEARYRALFDAIDEGFCVAEVRFNAEIGATDYRIVEANPAFYANTGFDPEILGQWLRTAAPGLEEHWFETYGRVARTGEPTRFEQGSDLLGRWYDVYAFRIGAPEDSHVAILFNDVSERKRHEEHTQLLIRELNHRAKNLLSLIQAIARQTAATRPEDFVERFGQRIRALAANQDLLLKGDWKAVPLGDLVRSQIGPLADARVTVSGPPLEITASAAQTLSMALHELVTNAAKYGALSISEGTAAVRWDLHTDPDGAPRFAISWTETGGPAVAPPTRRGFGSTVIERMVQTSFGGDVELRFFPTGVVWRLDCPAENLLSGRTTAE